MRISSNTIYETGVKVMQDQQIALSKFQQQLSTGRRILSPSDDPVASARSLEITQTQSVNQQYIVNAKSAKSTLGLAESVLGSITNLIQDVRENAVKAGNPTIGAANYASLGASVRSRYDELLGYANQKDGSGQYMFSGYYQGAAPPFTQVNGAGTYIGDQGQRKIQISPARQIETNDSGAAIFKPGVTGQDIFKTLDDLANALNSATTPASAATAVTTALNGLDAALSNVSQIRASVGLRLKELDAAQSASEDFDLQYSTTLSSLQDVDYAKTISDMTQSQFNLQAAQKTYMQITDLSLFKLI